MRRAISARTAAVSVAMSLQPLMRRKLRSASSMPAPTQWRTILVSVHLFTRAVVVRTTEIIDSMLVGARQRPGETIADTEAAHGEHVVEAFAQARRGGGVLRFELTGCPLRRACRAPDRCR